MIQQLIATIYELLHGLQDTPLYADSIYPQIGAAMLALALIAVGVFYYVIGWITARYNMLRHWVIALVLNCALSMLVVLAVGRSEFGTWNMPAPVFTLVLIQGLYAAVLFTLLSFMVKWGSPNSRRTPC